MEQNPKTHDIGEKNYCKDDLCAYKNQLISVCDIKKEKTEQKEEAINVKTKLISDNKKKKSEDGYCTKDEIPDYNKTVNVVSLCHVKIEEDHLNGQDLQREDLSSAKTTNDPTLPYGGQKSCDSLPLPQSRDTCIIPMSFGNNSYPEADDRPFQCKECSKKFKSVYNLRKHVRNHTSEKCAGCGRGFLSKSQLAKHVSMCVKPYQCEECDERFIYIGNLSEHMKFHRGEEPCNMKELRLDFGIDKSVGGQRKYIRKKQLFPCSECPKTFYRKSNLHSHLLSHSGIQPYECRDCYKKFNRKTDLSNHKRRCEKPLMCEVCRQTFIYIGNLTEHMKVHGQTDLENNESMERDKPYVCSLCGIRFVYVSNLAKHLKSKHGDAAMALRDSHETHSGLDTIHEHFKIIKTFSSGEMEKTSKSETFSGKTVSIGQVDMDDVQKSKKTHQQMCFTCKKKVNRDGEKAFQCDKCEIPIQIIPGS